MSRPLDQALHQYAALPLQYYANTLRGLARLKWWCTSRHTLLYHLDRTLSAEGTRHSGSADDSAQAQPHHEVGNNMLTCILEYAISPRNESHALFPLSPQSVLTLSSA